MVRKYFTTKFISFVTFQSSWKIVKQRNNILCTLQNMRVKLHCTYKISNIHFSSYQMSLQWVENVKWIKDENLLRFGCRGKDFRYRKSIEIYCCFKISVVGIKELQNLIPHTIANTTGIYWILDKIYSKIKLCFVMIYEESARCINLLKGMYCIIPIPWVLFSLIKEFHLRRRTLCAAEMTS